LVTERFFENSGFSLVSIGANRKTNPKSVKNANEKFNFVLLIRILLLKITKRGITIRKSIADNDASIKLKLRKVIAKEGSLNNKLM
jgi:hypothetical protein